MKTKELKQQSNKVADKIISSTSNNTCDCPYCESPSKLFISSSDVNRHTTKQVFQYFQCSVCSLVFLSPIPDDMAQFYRGGYQTIPTNLNELKKIAHKERFRMDSILEYVQKGRLLEIGPWIGIFSCNAKMAGFEVSAIEMDQDCVTFLNNILGIHAIQSVEPELAIGTMEDKFDVIALWHCLEHLPKPWTVLEEAAKKLTPNGILLVSIPNIESYDFSVLGKGWLHLDAPRHLYQFPIRWLEYVGSRCNLAVLNYTTHDRLSQVISKHAWHKRASLLIPIRYVRGILGLILYSFAKPKSRDKNAGGGLTVIFQKAKTT